MSAAVRPRRAAPGIRPVRRRPALMIVAVCLYWWSLYLYVPFLAPQAHRLGAGVGGAGLVLAAYGIVQFVLRIPTGLATDRAGRRLPFLLASLGACGVAGLGMGLARTPALLGVFRGVSGLGACGWVAITLLFAEAFPPERASWAFGMITFLAAGSQLAAQFAGGLLAQASGGYALPFLGAAGLAVAGIATAAAVAEVPPRVAPDAQPATLLERLAVGRQRHVLVASGLSIGSHFLQFATVFGFIPLLATLRFGAGGVALGVVSLAAGAPSALASLGSAALSARTSARAVAVGGFILATAGTALLPLAPALPALDVAAGVVGLGLGLLAPTLMSAAVHGFGPERRGTAMGFYQSIYAIGMFTGPALAGAAGHVLGLGAAFETAAVVGVAGAVAAWRLLAPA